MALVTADELRGIGSGLTDASIQRGTRPRQPRVVVLTARDIEIFAWLEQLRYLTTRMIAVLFWGAYGSAVRERLALLHDAGYLEKFRPMAANGTHEWIYRLTEKAWQALADAGRSTTARLPLGTINYIGYVEHDLQLTATLMRIALDAWPGTSALASRLPIQWTGPETGRIDPNDHTHRPGVPGAAALPEGHTVRPGSSRHGILEPDATLIGTHATTGRPTAVLFEYDRTRRPNKQTDRWRRYDHFLTDGWRSTRYATHGSEPALVYILAADSLLPTFLREADKHLTGWTGPHGAAAEEGTYPGRDQIAFTSRQRLDAGNWAMEQVPPLPPDVRGGDRFARRTIDFPIMQLFATRPRGHQPTGVR